jgi:hypothetical protein
MDDTTQDKETATLQPDIHHVYLDLEQGTWGARESLVVLSLTTAELEAFTAKSDNERITEWKGSNRYFGGVGIRKHLSMQDKPQQA